MTVWYSCDNILGNTLYVDEININLTHDNNVSEYNVELRDK